MFVDISGRFPDMKGRFMWISIYLSIYLSIYIYIYGCISIWDEELDQN